MIVLETDRLIIRESSGQDFSRIYCMMLSESKENENSASYGEEAGLHPGRTIRDTVSEDENEELEKYLAYIHTVYSVFGFGLWTVCLKNDPAGEDRVNDVRPFTVTKREGNLFTFETQVTGVHAGTYKVAVRMYPKNDKLPHRQDFAYVKWFEI